MGERLVLWNYYTAFKLLKRHDPIWLEVPLTSRSCATAIGLALTPAEDTRANVRATVSVV